MAPSKVLKIMFVDDDSDESYLFNEALEQSELPILLTRAHEGNQLLKMLDEGEQPDIILIDLNMPYKDGMEVIAEIRSKEEFNNIFVIIYSITADSSVIKRAFETGADLYLVKPDDFEGMLSVVRKIYNIDWAHFSRPTRDKFVLDLYK